MPKKVAKNLGMLKKARQKILGMPKKGHQKNLGGDKCPKNNNTQCKQTKINSTRI